MVFLVQAFFFWLHLGFAAVPNAEVIHCDSADEFKNSIEILKKEDGLNLNDRQIIQESLLISKGCNHASVRFYKVFKLLKYSGVDLKSSFGIAVQFTTKDDQLTKNFLEIFKKIYLENYLNMDFTTALKYSLALSENYQGNSDILREDFTQLVRFCTKDKEMALSLRFCAEMALELIPYSSFYPQGEFADFKKIYSFLRTHKQLGLSIKEALKIVPRVLSQGPKAPDNFIKTIELALTGEALKLSPQQAVNLALSVSNQSMQRKELK